MIDPTAIYLTRALTTNFKDTVKKKYQPREALIKSAKLGKISFNLKVEANGKEYSFTGNLPDAKSLRKVYHVGDIKEMVGKYINVYSKNLNSKNLLAIQKDCGLQNQEH
jgi:hypothetical protein